jgi:hypothetical protein
VQTTQQSAITAKVRADVGGVLEQSIGFAHKLAAIASSGSKTEVFIVVVVSMNIFNDSKIIYFFSFVCLFLVFVCQISWRIGSSYWCIECWSTDDSTSRLASSSRL